MTYKINPEVWSSVFAVPCRIVDECINLAGKLHLQVLLLLLRHGADGISADEIAKILRSSAADVSDALEYWAQQGVLLGDGEAPAPAKPAAAEKTEKLPPKEPPARALPELPQIKPDLAQIADRCEESPELKYLYAQAEKILGRTVGYDTQATLLMLHDTYGLPIEVILMIMRYGVSVGKRSMGYIAKIGKDWAEREIVTLERADEEIRKLTQRSEVWKKFRSLSNVSNPTPTANQQKYFAKWSEEWGFSADIIYMAYEDTIERTGMMKLEYMNKILENWRSQGISTPAMVMENKRLHTEKFAAEKSDKAAERNGAQNKKPSYDIDLFIKKAMQGAPASQEDD